MKTFVPFSKIKNKTIEGISDGGKWLISFTDGTYTAISIYVGYEDGHWLQSEEDLDLYCMDDEYKAGIVTLEEKLAIEEAEHNRIREEREAKEREALARLRAKYE